MVLVASAAPFRVAQRSSLVADDVMVVAAVGCRRCGERRINGSLRFAVFPRWG
jgi:hypothetical protein